MLRGRLILSSLMLFLFGVQDAYASDIPGMIGRTSNQIIDGMFGNPWFVVIFLMILFTILFYYVFLLGLIAIPHLNSDDKKKALTVKIAKTLGFIASLGLFGFTTTTRGPEAVMENAMNILGTVRLVAVWGIAFLMGGMAYFSTKKSHSRYPYPSNNKEARGKWSYVFVTVFFTLAVGYGLLGESGASLTFFVLTGLSFIIMILPTEHANPFANLPSFFSGSGRPPSPDGSPGGGSGSGVGTPPGGSPGSGSGTGSGSGSVTPSPGTSPSSGSGTGSGSGSGTPSDTPPGNGSSSSTPSNTPADNGPGARPGTAPSDQIQLSADGRESKRIAVWDQMATRLVEEHAEILKDIIIPGAESLKKSIKEKDIKHDNIRAQHRKISESVDEVEKHNPYRKLWRIERRMTKYAKKTKEIADAKATEVESHLSPERPNKHLQLALNHLKTESNYAEKIRELATLIQNKIKDVQAIKKKAGKKSPSKIIKRVDVLLDKPLKRAEPGTGMHPDAVKQLEGLLDDLISFSSETLNVLNQILEYSHYIYTLDLNEQALEKELAKIDSELKKQAESLPVKQIPDMRPEHEKGQEESSSQLIGKKKEGGGFFGFFNRNKKARNAVIALIGAASILSGLNQITSNKSYVPPPTQQKIEHIVERMDPGTLQNIQKVAREDMQKLNYNIFSEKMSQRKLHDILERKNKEILQDAAKIIEKEVPDEQIDALAEEVSQEGADPQEHADEMTRQLDETTENRMQEIMDKTVGFVRSLPQWESQSESGLYQVLDDDGQLKSVVFVPQRTIGNSNATVLNMTMRALLDNGVLSYEEHEGANAISMNAQVRGLRQQSVQDGSGNKVDVFTQDRGNFLEMVSQMVTAEATR